MLNGVILVLAAGASSIAVAADGGEPLVLAAPPRESADAGAALYGPLAEHLSRLLGRPVVYRHPGNWLNYARDMRADRYDIMFDGPHFTAWRVVHLEHRVLARLPGELVFHLVQRADQTAVESLADLVGKKLCGMAPPNLGTVTAISMFPNPARQPEIKAVSGGFGAVYEALATQQCDAGVLRAQYYDAQLSATERARLRILRTSDSLPNQAVSVGRRISEREAAMIAESLLAGAAADVAGPLAQRFGRGAGGFVPVAAGEYRGVHRLLEGVVFGW